MAEMYNMPHKVLSFEADVTGKLSLPMIFNLAIVSSTQQSIDLGVGPERLHDMGLGWVILQHVVDIKRRPNEGEEVVLQTMAQEFNPYFAKRLYRITDKVGHVLINIEALYTMLDMEKRKIAKIPELMATAYEPERVKKVARQEAPRVFDENDKADYTQEYAVRYLDIDSNKHVNNSRYFDWIQDVLDDDFVKTHEPSHLNIKYEHEVLLGDWIKSEAVVDRNKLETIHRIWSGDTLSAEASINWTLVDN